MSDGLPRGIYHVPGGLRSYHVEESGDGSVLVVRSADDGRLICTLDLDRLEYAIIAIRMHQRRREIERAIVEAVEEFGET